MASDTDYLKELEGVKVKKIVLEWDNMADDYFIDSIVFENGFVLGLHGVGDLVGFYVDKIVTINK